MHSMQTILEQLRSAAHEPEGINRIPSTAQADRNLLDAYSQAVTRAAETISPAVVNVEVRHRADGRRGERLQEGSGSGFVYTRTVSSLPTVTWCMVRVELRVMLTDGREFEAQLVATTRTQIWP